jgi:Ca2+-binding EF-hand superfamily protein
MEKLENEKELADEFEAKCLLEKFAQTDKHHLNETEFYDCIGHLLSELKASEWLQQLKDENYFQVFLKNGENTIDANTFAQVYHELKLLSNPGILNGPDEIPYEIDFEGGF